MKRIVAALLAASALLLPGCEAQVQVEEAPEPVEAVEPAEKEPETLALAFAMPAAVAVSVPGKKDLTIRDGTLKWALVELVNGVPLLPWAGAFPPAEASLTFYDMEGEAEHTVAFAGDALVQVDGVNYRRAEGAFAFSLLEDLYGGDNAEWFQEVLAGDRPYFSFAQPLGLTDLEDYLSAVTFDARVVATTLLDLDGDGAAECVAALGPGDYGFMLFWREGDTVYGHPLPYRGFRDLHADGTFSYASGAADAGIGRLTLSRFGAETVPITWSGFEGEEIKYYVNGQPSDQAGFWAAWEAWDALPLQPWAEVPGENAEWAALGLSEDAVNLSGETTLAALRGEAVPLEGVQTVRTGGLLPPDFDGAPLLIQQEDGLSALPAALREAVAGYDGAWFSRHDLAVYVVEEGSGSVRHRVDWLRISPEGWFTARITSLDPEVGTADMASWHILIPLPKGLATAPAETPLFRNRENR